MSVTLASAHCGGVGVIAASVVVSLYTMTMSLISKFDVFARIRAWFPEKPVTSSGVR